MRQFITVDLKGIVGEVRPIKGGTLIVVYINETDNQGNFVKTQKVFVNLFNNAQRAVLKRNTKKGDGILILKGNYNTFSHPDGSTLSAVVCNFADQIAIFANENHDILDQRNTEEYSK